MHLYFLLLFIRAGIALTTPEEDEAAVGIVAADEEALTVDDRDEALDLERDTYQMSMTKLENDVINKLSFEQRRRPDPSNGTVKIRFLLHKISHISINQTEGSMRVIGRICTLYNDPLIKWDPAKYDGVTVSTSLFCPNFQFRVGCVLDVADYPYDKHVCAFHMVEYSAGAELVPYYPSDEMLLKLRYSALRSEKKAQIADFTINSISAKIQYISHDDSGDELFLDQRASPGDVSVASNTVTFTRYAPYFFYTLVLPSILFGLITALAPILSFTQACFLLLSNLLLLTIYMRGLIKELPPHFSTFPRIVWYWAIQMTFTSAQLLRIFLYETIRRHRGEPLKRMRLDDEWSNLPFRQKYVNVDTILA
ncbi:unnamed protein product, partial [Mesorhabditis spiculigera]